MRFEGLGGGACGVEISSQYIEYNGDKEIKCSCHRPRERVQETKPILVGRTPGSARVPPDPHFARRIRSSRQCSRPTRASAAEGTPGPGVRPTVYTRDATVAWRIGGLCDSSEGFDHRRCKSVIRRGLGEFLDGMA